MEYEYRMDVESNIVRKSLYASPSVLGYAPPHSNSMRGLFFRFPLFAHFAVTRGVPARFPNRHTALIINQLAATIGNSWGTKPRRL
jgi:hypothetical protein